MRLQHTESDGCHMRGITSDRNYARWQNFLVMHERSGRVKIPLITGSLVRRLPHSKMQTLKLCRREEPGNFSLMSSVKSRESVSLQKQVGCFNHRVVVLVPDKLEGQWLLEVCFDVED